MWFVIGLVWLAVIWGIFRVYRKKREKHAGARAKQIEALFLQLKLDPKLPAGATSGAATPIAVAPTVTLPLPEFVKKQRLLPQAEALLYYVFRAGLPDHEIFVNLTLSDLVDVEPMVRGYEREQKARRLAQARLNLVICTKQLDVVGVAVIVNNAAPNALEAMNMRLIEECLQTAGIKLMRIDPATPPRHHQVRGLVYGVTGQAASAAASVIATEAPPP